MSAIGKRPGPLAGVLALLSFADARPRGFSESEYNETDELRLADFVDGLTFRRGTLYFHADYLRGRRVKTGITVTAQGSITIETIGRGKGPLRWIDRLKGDDESAHALAVATVAAIS